MMLNATPDPTDWIGPDEYLGQHVYQHRHGTFADGCKYVVLYDNGEEALFEDLNEAYAAVVRYDEDKET